jgi:hypothetical protein
MNTVTGDINMEGIPNLQDLLDAVPDDRRVACLPTHDAIILHDGEKELGRIPLDGIVDVSILDDSSVQRHLTIGRFLFLGPLAFLFPKTTIREAYRLCIQWKVPDGGYYFTYIRIPTRIMADHMLNTVKHSLTPAVRTERAQKAIETKEHSTCAEKEQHQGLTETSPFITCAYCTVEFRKIDIQPGGKCPVCGRPLRY